MFRSLKIEEYNINVINLNFLIHKNIKTDIQNFLYDNNLNNFKIKNKDYNSIINHFIVENLIQIFEEDYYNIIIFNKQIESSTEEEILKTIINNIEIIIKKFNLNYFEIETEFSVDTNTIYKLKQIIESKKTKRYKKLITFCEKNGLTKITDLVKNNIKTKLILHK
jgi:hypothetical protein